MTTWGKFVNGVAFLVVIAAVGVWLSSYTWATDLDRAIVWNGRTHNDISDIVARYLPNDFNGAVRRLRELGFKEGNRYVGASYRHRPVPEPNEVNEVEAGMIRDFNGILDEHDAVVAKPFHREVILFGARDFSLEVYLLTRRNGTMTVYARSHTPAIFP